jgi:hypothetical protein
MVRAASAAYQAFEGMVSSRDWGSNSDYFANPMNYEVFISNADGYFDVTFISKPKPGLRIHGARVAVTAEDLEVKGKWWEK